MDSVLNRWVHTFCQAVEVGMRGNLLESCPDPSKGLNGSFNHPFSRKARCEGNSALKQSLVARFQSRGGGYVSTKADPKLSELGVISSKSNLGSRTSQEYCSRILVKTAEHCSSMSHRRVINIAFDGASIAQESVHWAKIMCNKRVFLSSIWLFLRIICGISVIEFIMIINLGCSYSHFSPFMGPGTGSCDSPGRSSISTSYAIPTNRIGWRTARHGRC